MKDKKQHLSRIPLEETLLVEETSVSEFVNFSTKYIEYLSRGFHEDPFTISQTLYKYIVATLQKNAVDISISLLDMERGGEEAKRE